MSSYTAEESKQANINAMGQELGPLYDAMWQQVAWLHDKWEEYVELYGTKESRLTLLNKAAPLFFRIVQDTLWEDVLLHICRLTDSPQFMNNANKANLSIRRFPAAIDDGPTKIVVETLIAEALTASEFCRDWRIRHIAHRDLRLALDPTAPPLKPASRAKIKEAIKAIDAVLNAISSHYLDSTTDFSSDGTAHGAVSLLYVLDDGIKAEQARRERMKNGTSTPEDFERRDL
jgi:hypothetical protein